MKANNQSQWFVRFKGIPGYTYTQFYLKPITKEEIEQKAKEYLKKNSNFVSEILSIEPIFTEQ